MLEIPGYSCTLNTCSITGRSLLRPRSLCVLSWVVSLCSSCWLSAPDVAKTILELLVLSPASQDPSLVIYMLCIFPDQRTFVFGFYSVEVYVIHGVHECSVFMSTHLLWFLVWVSFVRLFSIKSVFFEAFIAYIEVYYHWCWFPLKT